MLRRNSGMWRQVRKIYCKKTLHSNPSRVLNFKDLNTVCERLHRQNFMICSLPIGFGLNVFGGSGARVDQHFWGRFQRVQARLTASLCLFFILILSCKETSAHLSHFELFFLFYLHNGSDADVWLRSNENAGQGQLEFTRNQRSTCAAVSRYSEKDIWL